MTTERRKRDYDDQGCGQNSAPDCYRFFSELTN
jgi:hypothetical protein